MLGAKKLLLRLFLVGLGHIGLLFIVYGIKLRFFFIADPWKDYAFQTFLVCSPVISFALNYFFISRSNLLPENMHRTKATLISIAATSFSLYWGMFLCLNTFGS